MVSLNPINYRLHLEPDLKTFSFKATADIRLHVDAPTDSIVLNALDLTVHRCLMRDRDIDTPCAFRLNPEKETLEITPPGPVSGTIQLVIDYTGEINNRMAGFYRSQYGGAEDPKFIAVTQFQESDARRAFPCLDHPLKKATFDVEMVIDKNHVALSNDAVFHEEQLDNGKQRIRFQQTPKMSTYLVFFGVGEFRIMEDPEDPRVRIVSLPGREPYTRFGLEFGRKALRFCEDYFDIPYPLRKMDLIAVPDFAFGAMENWGAITFRENLLLHYPETTSKAGEERICEVTAHEIVHQWFGNLVTPSDWKYLWLNESFATYFGYGVVDHHYPEWDTWHQFLYTTADPALERDALKETFSIEIPAGDHVAINAATAPIIYNKGGSLLRQIHGYIGDELFRKGLRHFLKKHAYGCAASHHLWEAFEAVSEKPLTRMVKSWIEQPGFPVIEAERDGTDVILTQKRFTFLDDSFDQNWIVPVRIRVFDRSGEEKTVHAILDKKSDRIPIGSDAAAYAINYGRTGFFRTKYSDDDNLDCLGGYISDKTLAPEDRWGVENDLFALVKGGDQKLDRYLEFLEHYRAEDAYLPLSSITDHLFYFYRILAPEDRPRILSMGKMFAERILTDIGCEPSDDDPHTISLLRDRLLWYAVVYGSAGAESFAKEKFRLLMQGERVHPDIQKGVMQAGAWIENGEAYGWFENRFLRSHSEHDRINILTAMGCFQKKKTLEKTLRFTLGTVPDRNKFIPILSAAANPCTGSFLWDWYLSERKTLESFHPLLYERVITGIIPMCGMDKADTVHTFFSDYLNTPAAPRDAIRMSLERLKINCRMRLK
jgi:aminopeptidase N